MMEWSGGGIVVGLWSGWWWGGWVVKFIVVLMVGAGVGGVLVRVGMGGV